MLLGDQNKIHFALGVHNHQPIGNWDRVIEDGYQHSYLPFIDVLERHPGVHVSIHYAGHLLTWLAEHHPEFIERLRALVAKGQVELLTGGLYEPVLAVIPDEDKIGQIHALTETLRTLTGAEPEGMWLAGRLWEPQLAKPIHEAGVRYTLLDDTHFKAVGMRAGELFGYYQTEEQGQALSVLPLQRELATMIPFQPPERVIEYLRQQATPDGSRLALCFDDGEKFGSWPNTYQTVYLDGWLDRFFGLLEEHRDWLTPCTISEYTRLYRPWGRVYLPSCAPVEMQEWSLPAEQAAQFALARAQTPAPAADFLRGGDWRHFFVKYPESNNLHKKMLRVSELLARATAQAAAPASGERAAALATAGDKAPTGRADASTAPAALLTEARAALWRGQSNDPYWHGIYGGLYVNHLRSANYSALLQAESACDAARFGAADFCEVELVDFDRDGAREALVSNREQNLYVTPHYGGALFEHDFKPRHYNLLDTLARRPEAYHAQIHRAVSARDAQAQSPAQLGERPVSKETGLERYLHYDWYRRLSLLDHFLHPDTRLETFHNMSFGEQGDFINQAYNLTTSETDEAVVLRLARDGHVWIGTEFWPVRVEKVLTCPKRGAGFVVDYTVTNLWDRPLETWFGVEFNLNMRSAVGPERRYYSESGRAIEPSHLGAMAQDDHMSEIGLRDDALGLDVHFSWSEPGNLWRFPLETVSRSESGFERVYQSTVLLPHWRLALAANGSWSCRLEQRLQ